MSEIPLVSVVIPTYNRRSKVTDAIDSVLSQDYPAIEVVVVDDGSTDGTGKHVQERYHGRVRYIYQENREKSAARNRGIREARGELLSMLDSDDLMLAGAVRSMVDCFRRHPDADAVYGSSLRQRAGTVEEEVDRRKYPDGDILPFYLEERIINNNSFMIKRELMLRYGMYREELTNHEDFEMLLRLTSRLNFYFCGAPVCMVRRTEGSAKDDYGKIIAQGVRAMDCLFSTPGLPGRLLRMKKRLYAGECLTVAAACYRAGRYRLFRDYYRMALSYDPRTLFRPRFLRRYIVSLAR